MRLIGELAERVRRRERPGHARSEPGVPVGAEPATSTSCIAACSAAGLARPGAGTLADVTSCPGAESCKLAVTQSRGLGRLLGRTARTSGRIWSAMCPGSTSRSAAVRTAAASITSRASASRAACARSAAGRRRTTSSWWAAATADGNHDFGRHAATMPARRCDEALERLVQLYRDQQRRRRNRRWGSSGASKSATVKSRARGSRQARRRTRRLPNDFIDLAEDHAFDPEVQEGECSA